MPAARLVLARFVEVRPVRDDVRGGVWMRFRPERTRPDLESIEHFADLGPELSVEAVRGVGCVARVLRAARIALPGDPLALVGRVDEAAELLERAIGTPLRIGFKTRSRLRFLAWTENGLETVNDVAEVRELDDAFFVTRQGGRFPVRVDRASVVRQRTECERWYEILEIERA